MAMALPNDHFIEFFPDTSSRFSTILTNDCSGQVAEYFGLQGSDCSSYAYFPTCLSAHLVNCMLSHTEEVYKADMAAAGVLLGLLPSILALVATSFVERGLLSMRRPVLGSLLTLGSPIVSPMRVLDFQNPREVLGTETLDLRQIPRIGSGRALAISLLEYVLALGSVFNSVELAYEIGVKSVCSFATNNIWHPLLWTMLPLLIHALGIWSIRLRLGFAAPSVAVGTKSTSWTFLSHEALPSLAQPEIRLVCKPKTFWSISVLWFTSICTLMHIVYGTLIYSSIIFVSVEDAARIIWTRYLLSALVCRGIFVFELGGMKKVFVNE